MFLTIPYVLHNFLFLFIVCYLIYELFGTGQNLNQVKQLYIMDQIETIYNMIL